MTTFDGLYPRPGVSVKHSAQSRSRHGSQILVEIDTFTLSRGLHTTFVSPQLSVHGRGGRYYLFSAERLDHSFDKIFRQALTRNVVNVLIGGMLDVEVIDNPAAAAIVVEPVKNQLLAALAEPASAATLAARLGIPRQKVNYHLRSLEDHGLVRISEERLWGGLTERVMVASAASYIVSPAALGPVAADPERRADRLSASYLIALAARIVREVSTLVRRAGEAQKQLATLSIDTEIRFKSPADRAAFSQELTDAVTSLVSRYHDANAPGGRAHRLVIMAHPLPQG
jgi:DNA-binding transcriptional ArsR family regulator